MANKHSSKSKHKKKHKKEKSKHKKEKKSRKDEKERRRKYSSSSSSSNSSADDVKASPKQHEWNLLESALTETKIFDRDQNKTNKTKDANIYDPKHNVRELNPYWRENGTGLPPTVSLIFIFF